MHVPEDPGLVEQVGDANQTLVNDGVERHAGSGPLPDFAGRKLKRSPCGPVADQREVAAEREPRVSDVHQPLYARRISLSRHHPPGRSTTFDGGPRLSKVHS